MTLDEKISLCHAGSKFAVSAIPRLGIPEFWMSDGPHGVRREICRDSWDPVETEDRSTYLLPGTALAATSNPDLARRYEEALCGEARHRGKDVILGPGINIVRTPLCGRNFEYYGEDPFHVAKMVVPAVEGIQSQQVAACVKHYAANSQELNRQGVDAELGERALREIYLPGFEAAVVRGKCLTVMGAYNRFRGQYCSHNQYLVNEILKGEWRFDGCFLSDWEAVEDTAQAAKCGPFDLKWERTSPTTTTTLRPFARRLTEANCQNLSWTTRYAGTWSHVSNRGVRSGSLTGERNTGRHHQIALGRPRGNRSPENDCKVLPLDDQRLSRLVVIGHNAVARTPAEEHSSVKALHESPSGRAAEQARGNGPARLFSGFRLRPAILNASIRNFSASPTRKPASGVEGALPG
jgi:beta-glucosidase